MKIIQEKYPICIIFGFLSIITFCTFFLISAAFFPGIITPLNNWISDLGNSSLNPNGATFFNLGCILTGILLFPYFFGLKKLSLDNKWQKSCMIVGQTAGCCSAFALIMVGVFSEDIMDIHLFWSNIYFTLNMLFLLFFTISLLKHPDIIRSIKIYGVIIMIIDVFFVSFVIRAPPPNQDPDFTRVILMMLKFLEWFTIFASLSYIGLIIYNMHICL